MVRMEPLLHMGLRYTEASYDAQAGDYRIRWELTDAEHVNISISVPFGCSALLKLPLAPEKIYQDSANPIFSDMEDGICCLQMGNYQVQYQLTNFLKQIFSTHTVIRELIQHRDIVEALKGVVDLRHIPNQYMGLSICDMAAKYGRMGEEQLNAIDVILRSV